MFLITLRRPMPRAASMRRRRATTSIPARPRTADGFAPRPCCAPTRSRRAPTVYIDAGAYTMLTDAILTAAQFQQVVLSLGAGQQVTFQGPTTGTATSSPCANTTNGYVFNFQGASFVTINDLTLTDGYGGVLLNDFTNSVGGTASTNSTISNMASFGVDAGKRHQFHLERFPDLRFGLLNFQHRDHSFAQLPVARPPRSSTTRFSARALASTTAALAEREYQQQHSRQNFQRH